MEPEFFGTWFRGGVTSNNAGLAEFWEKSARPPVSSPGAPLYISELAPPNSHVVDTGEINVAFSGMLYNHKELSTKYALINECRVYLNNSIVINAYRKDGIEFVSEFVGDFSCIIWDSIRHELILARDRFGVRSLYYAIMPDATFVFANRIRTARDLLRNNLSIDQSRIALFFIDLVPDNCSTFYQEIKRLPPGHVMRVTQDESRCHRYYNLSDITTVYGKADLEYAAAFRARLDRAIERRIDPNSRWCVSLSGGLDSASIACAAASLASSESCLSTFSILYTSDKETDERQYMESITRKHGIAPNYFEANDVAILDCYDRIIDILSEPFANPYYSVGWGYWNFLRENGIEFVLDGIDGDITISYHFGFIGELLSEGRIVDAMRECVGISRRFYGGRISPLSIFWRRGILPLAGKGTYQYQPQSLLNREFRESVRVAELVGALLSEEKAHYGSLERHIFDLSHPVLVQSLEHTHALAETFGIEHRHPYLDQELIEFCLALPREQKIKDGWTRPIVRRALKQELPVEILRRGEKWDPTSYFLNRFREDGLAPAKSRVLDCTDRLRQYIDVKQLTALIGRLDRVAEMEDVSSLLRIYVFLIWLDANK